MKSLFEICTPREDILTGSVKESSYAADLAQVLKREGPLEYRDANTFYENTHPTEGLKNLLSNVCKRLSGSGQEAASIFRLDTQYGGGKTHALIALAHLAREGSRIDKIDELVSRDLLPDAEVAIGAFDGENSDPLNGRDMPGGVKAYTPWGELACQLGGTEGYMKVRESDLERAAPGSETLRSLFGDRPVLILLDELSIYLRKIQGRTEEKQMTPFLTSLFKAIESAPKAVLVFTLAIGREGIASDAYASENEQLAKQIEELASVAGRKATTLDPTSENETAQVLSRRLFKNIDKAGLEENVQGYKEVWHKHQDQLPDLTAGESWEEEFRNSFPFHPNLMSVLTNKLSTLNNFQRVRGMLRLLAGAVSELWETKPSETYAIHLQHLNPANEGIKNEIVTRLELSAFDPAMRNDITDPASVSNDLDTKYHAGMAPLTSYLSRSILWHTFAFNEPIKGVPSDELNFALLYPGIDPSFINDARQRFIQNSGFLDDKPMAPLKFLTEANLNVLIRRKERDINPGDSRDQLQDRIRNIFDAKTFNLIIFPSGPFDVPDEVGDGKPQLVLIHYENIAVSVEPDSVPKSIEDMFNTQGAQGNFRQLKNNLMFLVAEDQRVDEMKEKMTRRLALEALQTPDQLQSLPDHQQYKVRELFEKADQELAVAIQKTYRHLFFPSRSLRLPNSNVDLGHVTFDIPSTAAQPGAGQAPIARALRDNTKLLRDEDPPQAPRFFRDQTLLKSKGFSDTAELRSEYRKNVLLPIMLGDDNYLRLLSLGIEDGIWIYKSGELLVGPGDPPAQLKIDSQCQIMTLEYAEEKSVWPRVTDPTDPTDPTPSGSSFSTEGPLRQALTQIWEQARSSQEKAIKKLNLRLFDMQDGFRMISALKTVQNAKKVVFLKGEYETDEESLCSIDFEGQPDDALPLKDFLEPQFRAASEKNLESTFEITFESGLDLSSSDPEDMTERLVRIVQGSASVLAWAEAE